MMLKDGAVNFYEIRQDSFVHDYVENIPFGDYLCKEEPGENYVDIRSFGADKKVHPARFVM